MLLVVTIVFGYLFSFSPSYADSYFGVFGGYEFDPKPTNLTTMEDMGYSTSTANLHPATSSDLELKQSMVGGVKFGSFLDSNPNFGFELSSMYSRPDLKPQYIAITLTDGYNALGSNKFTEDHLPADFHFITTEALLIYRFNPINRFRPYVGLGPVVYVVVIHGDGRSGKLVSPFVTSGYNNGTRGDGFGTGLGLAGKIGVEYLIDNKWSLDFEYQASKGTLNIDHFSSFSDISVNFSDQIITTGLRHNF